jgi:hypothetical protein
MMTTNVRRKHPRPSIGRSPRMLHRLARAALFSAFLSLAVLPIATAEPVGVSLFGDASGDLAAVSVFGNATCSPTNTVGNVGMCAAVSGTGDSSCAPAGEYGCGLGASGTGNTNTWSGASLTGASTGYYVVSGSNQCRFTGETSYEKCVDASLTGPANAHDLAVSALGDASGFYAVSGAGSATAKFLGVSGTGSSTSGIAIAVLGNASGPSPVLYDDNVASASLAGSSAGNLVSLSVLGSSTAHQVAVSVFGPANGPCAVSVLGETNGDCVGYAESIGCDLTSECLP